MIRLVRTEVLKQRTTPAFLIAFAAVPLLAVAVVAAVFGAAGHQGNDPLGPASLVQVLGAPASIVTTLALVLGVVGLGGEYRHQTITTTLLAAPRRSRVVAAKVVAHGLTGAAMAIVMVVVTAAIAVPWLVQADVAVDVGGDAARVAGTLVLSSALHAGLGVAVGALLRNQTLAVAVAIGWLLKIEELMAAALGSSTVADWLPADVGRAIVPAGPQARSLWAAAAVLALYVVALAAVGTRVVVDRDVS